MQSLPKQFDTNKIQVLDDLVVDQIAAGEVVERPFSVVKELVENAIDAQANSIRVIIDNGGKSGIEVIDTGCGMSAEDARLAVTRHATSKIQSISDLDNLYTLGFRGEALASIASVSHMRILTRMAGTNAGILLKLEGGRYVDQRAVDTPVGTSIKIERIFYNVPARRKFLKSERAESMRIKELVQDLALANPSIHFVLVVDGKLAFEAHASEDFFKRAADLKIAAENPIKVSATYRQDSGVMTVKGLLSKPIAAAKSIKSFSCLINGRAVRDKLIISAVRQAYGQYLKTDMFPRGVLALEIPGVDIDVNVHPQKMEVRFRDSAIIFRAVNNAIRAALASEGVPQASQLSTYRTEWNAENRLAVNDVQPIFNWEEPAIAEAPTATQEVSYQRKLSQLRYLGQILHCYLLLEDTSALVLVDMHAAHERVMFYRLKSSYMTGKHNRQRLLVPETIEFPLANTAEIEKTCLILRKLGFEAELFGEQRLIIREVPAMLSSAAPIAIVRNLLEDEDWSAWSQKVENHIDKVISRIACHRSIRAGREIKREEVFELLQQLEQAENSAFCPHGRPVYVSLSQVQLEQMFGRVLV